VVIAYLLTLQQSSTIFSSQTALIAAQKHIFKQLTIKAGFG
jgi:hypothetical protein